MKAKILLRISSIIMLLHALGHSVGASTWNQAPNAAIKQVIDGMTNNHLVFMGRTTTIASFYAGYGYILIAVLLFITVLLWLLSNQPQSSIILTLGLLLIVIAVLEYIFFFPLAALFSAFAGVLALIAYYKTRLVS